ncbi:MAG: putative Ig domain-containing protein [Proteobacteria bacterium]|nr:putative Ig domain-containing protein [Pseudomonadota bacterium]
MRWRRTDCSRAQTAPPPQAALNSAPQISGQPPNTASAGAAYSFTPTATDPNQDALSFSITNRPAWLTFSVATGQLSGTPTASNAGTYSNISITVSDGFTSATLGPFTINVQGPPRGTATLTWTAPAENTDGSPLGSLSGFWRNSFLRGFGDEQHGARKPPVERSEKIHTVTSARFAPRTFT